MSEFTLEMPEPEEATEAFDASDVSDIYRIRTEIYQHVRDRFNWVTHWKELPCRRGLYFVIDNSGRHEGERVVYIGMSRNLRTRWLGHDLREELESRIEPSGDWSLAWIEPNDDEFASLEHEEATYIAILNPRLNRVVNCTL